MQIKKDPVRLEKISKRLRRMREKSELSISQLREEIMMKENVSFSASTYCRWENAQRMPPKSAIKAFSDYFNVSEEWLLGECDPIRNTRELEFNKKLGVKNICIPKEELYLYRGEPVWTPVQGGKWALVLTDEDSVLFADGEKMSFYNIRISFFRIPIEYYYPVDSSMDPIPLKNLNMYEKVWIEPIKQEFSDRQKFKGWGNKSADKNCFINPITNMSYKLSEYGITWIAYEDIVKSC